MYKLWSRKNFSFSFVSYETWIFERRTCFWSRTRHLIVCLHSFYGTQWLFDACIQVVFFSNLVLFQNSKARYGLEPLIYNEFEWFIRFNFDFQLIRVSCYPLTYLTFQYCWLFCSRRHLNLYINLFKQSKKEFSSFN